MENIKKEFNVKTKKVGIKTLGIILIILGVLFLFEVIFKLDILKYIVLAWPIILIALGIEILIESKKSEIKISIGSFIIIAFLIGFSFFIGAANLLINDVLYSKDFFNEIVGNNRLHYLSENEEKISIYNYSENLVNLKVIEQASDESKILVDVEYDVQNNLIGIIKLMNNELYPIWTIKNGIEILDSSDNIKNITVTVITNNKNKIETIGNIEIVNK